METNEHEDLHVTDIEEVKDDEGNALFTEEDLNSLSPDVALKLFNECDELNKLRNNDLEERAKNS